MDISFDMSYDVIKHEIPDGMYRELYYTMALVREFETELTRLYARGLVHGSMHLCLGQEAAAVGSTAALKKDDYIFATHRGHGESIGKGADLKLMMAEVLGRSYCGRPGIGGSMHIIQPECGIMGSNGVVGAGVPVALGAALTIRYRKVPDRVSVCFFGDGAANQGVVLETMNLAGLWKLPIIFILVENGYAVSSRPRDTAADPDYVKRAMPFGLKGYDVDGNDILMVLYTVARAREYIMEGGGPCLVVEHTYRVSGHSRSDTSNYRTEAEIEKWRTANDPIIRYRAYLTDGGFCSADELDRIYERAVSKVSEARDEVLSMPESDFGAAELEQRVYAD